MLQLSLKSIGLSLILSLIRVEATPAEARVKPRNVLGTSLTDYIGCSSSSNNNQQDFINQAYTEAHTIVNVNGVKANVQWDSAAAIDFFGPPQLNKPQQGQIQAVLANVETMQRPYWFNPFGHSLQVRCDDPKHDCSNAGAYTVNPTGNEKPYINFCPKFFRQPSLDQAVNNYKNDKNSEVKWNVDSYLNRGLVFLHELFHLDLAADSVNNKPNPKIYDIKIVYETDRGMITSPEKAYEARLAKLLARFLPSAKSKTTTGYWVQRNVDNFSRYAMAMYLQGKLGGYTFMPLIYSRLKYPLTPDPRAAGKMISFLAGNYSSSDAIVTVIDPAGSSEADIDEPDNIDPSHTTDLLFKVGEPIGDDEYPDSYQQSYAKWVEILLQGNNIKPAPCKVDLEEIWTCGDDTSNLYASVRVTDSSGENLYTTQGSAHSPGQPIDADNPLHIKASGMKDTLTITGEHTKDYIQFSYGSTQWKSSDTQGAASCTPGQWNKDGPQGCPNAEAATRKFSCQYPCDG